MIGLLCSLVLLAPPDDAVVTRFLTVKHAPLEAARELLRGFASEGATVTLHAPSRTLIVTDTRRNTRRLEKLLRTIDADGGREHIYVRPVAAEHVRSIELVVGEDAIVVPDERTGSVVVITSQRQYQRVDRLIRRLDRPGRNTGRAAYVLKLHNASAKEMGLLIESILGRGKRKRRRKRR